MTTQFWCKKNSSPLYSNFILNLYIVYELNNWLLNPFNNFKLKNFLFDTIQLTTNADKSKFTCNGRWIAYHWKSMWSYGNDFARNVVIFALNNASSSHTDNETKYFLVLGEGPIEDINDSIGAAEKK